MNIVNVGYRSTNYYIIADTAPRLLIDVGWPGTLPDFQHVCKRLGVDLRAVKHMLPTHYHPDHAGLVQELKNNGTALIVLSTQISAIPLLSSLVKPSDKFTEIDSRNNITLDFDESRSFLAGIGIQGQIVSTPGHSDDSVTLILDDGAAFTGDLGHPMMAHDPADPIQVSWQKIRDMGVKTIYPGHGPVFQLD